MTAKGYGLTQTLREMNAKLKRILPVDMFCCATLLCLRAPSGGRWRCGTAACPKAMCMKSPPAGARR